MQKEFNLESYLTGGVEMIVKQIVAATFKNPKQSMFMAKYAIASKESSRLRKEAERRGEHIPPFLIASITSSCNLHCSGCYARANNACSDTMTEEQLTGEEWLRIFREAKESGIGFIILAGGEPFIRRDIIEAAGKIPQILFPIFTNGTLLDEQYLQLFRNCRNLVPIFSIEGDEGITDERRGSGTYEKLIDAMTKMQSNQLLFGTSVTVTVSNYKEVTSEKFLGKMMEKGCKVVFYVEYVPVAEEGKELALKEQERNYLNHKLAEIRNKFNSMIFVSFPGDELASGGCLAAGRGFFHINSHGGAEPCPFSPYSDINVKNSTLKDALHSKLFLDLQRDNLLMEEHEGGCVLFDKKDRVEEILANR